jgi:hypothetical protein
MKALTQFKHNIEHWRKMGLDSNDPELRDMYAKDTEDLKTVYNAYKQGRYDVARKFTQRLDTIVRDQIPQDIYNEFA